MKSPWCARKQTKKDNLYILYVLYNRTYVQCFVPFLLKHRVGLVRMIIPEHTSIANGWHTTTTMRE
jgi:hypothetical protein